MLLSPLAVSFEFWIYIFEVQLISYFFQIHEPKISLQCPGISKPRWLPGGSIGLDRGAVLPEFDLPL